MDTQLVCWKCGAPLDDIPLPLARLAECLVCRTELHVCLSCEFYDTRVAKQCRETIAEEVKDKARANFCDYYQLRPNAFQPRDDTEERAARSQLDALFGGGQKTDDSGGASGDQSSSDQGARNALDDLFAPRRKE
ncbi:MAG: hypothetical protein KKA36_06295 [Gammaproteobacteria bacterium]|nr:hypothetical protein [Gammaproteobacteria bacterium]MBU2478683.1 hypothetical protein [Gammaproteobacteria bacterium]